MDEQVYSPHPETGAPGTYKYVEGVGYVLISDMNTATADTMPQEEQAPEPPRYTPSAAGTGTGLFGTSTPITKASLALSEGFVQTDEMRAADERRRNSTPETEPENWTQTTNYGWIYTGPDRSQNTATQLATYMGRNVGGPNRDQLRQWKTGAWGWLHGGDAMEQAAPGEGAGFGNFTQDSWDRFRAMGYRGGNPLIDTNPHDIDEILALYKTDRFNPYAHYNYAAGNKEVRKGSVADVLYGLTKDKNQNKRMAAYNAIRGERGDMAQTRMSEGMWKRLGLNDIFGDWDEQEGLRKADVVANPLRAQRTGGSSVGRDGSFLKSYLESKAKHERRPGVLSMFKEMQDE